MPTTLKPWSILSGKSLLKSAPWLRVDSLKVRKADGGVIDNFVNRTWSDSCLIVPFVTKDQVVVVRQYKLAIAKALIEFPAGYMNDSESPLDAALRELREETGIAPEEMIPLGVLHREPHYSPTVVHIWMAKGVESKHSPQLDSTEELITDMLSPQEISGRIAYGEISSLYCVAAWGLVKEYLA